MTWLTAGRAGSAVTAGAGVVAVTRGADGQLDRVGEFRTGGRGGVERDARPVALLMLTEPPERDEELQPGVAR